MSVPDIDVQAAAVERAACNLAGHVANLRSYVAARKRPQHELDTALGWLPALQAAAVTMHKLALERAK